jgi:WhiB family redox-sensing transcriptional regulator
MPIGPDWMERASCVHLSLEESARLFFANGRPSREALGYCDPCPVRRECLQMALDNDEWGIWAGTTRPQRERMKRGRRSLDLANVQYT